NVGPRGRCDGTIPAIFSVLGLTEVTLRTAPRLHRTAPVTRTDHETGFTLIEVMVVVAVVGVLASVAVFMFGKQRTKARASEIPVVFGEFQLRQEQFHLENDEYLSTGNEAGFYPTTDPGKNPVMVDVGATAVAP